MLRGLVLPVQMTLPGIPGVRSNLLAPPCGVPPVCDFSGLIFGFQSCLHPCYPNCCGLLSVINCGKYVLRVHVAFRVSCTDVAIILTWGGGNQVRSGSFSFAAVLTSLILFSFLIAHFYFVPVKLLPTTYSMYFVNTSFLTFLQFLQRNKDEFKYNG